MEVTAGLPSSQKDLHLHLPCVSITVSQRGLPHPCTQLGSAELLVKCHPATRILSRSLTEESPSPLPNTSLLELPPPSALVTFGLGNSLWGIGTGCPGREVEELPGLCTPAT